MPQPEHLNRVSSSELARTSSHGLSAGASPSTSADMPATPMSGAAAEQATATSTAPPDQMSDQRKAWLEAHLPFLRYYCPATSRTSKSPRFGSFDCLSAMLDSKLFQLLHYKSCIDMYFQFSP